MLGWRFQSPAPITPVALISTLSDVLALGEPTRFTSIKVEQGKSPVKNSRRARHTSVFSSRLVTYTVMDMMSFILPPAASSRSLNFWKIDLA